MSIINFYESKALSLIKILAERGVVQAVGQRINLYFDEDFAENTLQKTSSLVFIGTHDIDEAQAFAKIF